MNRINFLFLGQRDDAGNVQVGFHGAFASAHLIPFVRFEAMQREPVFLRINGHGAQAEFIGGAKNANGDFAAVSGKQLANWFGLLHLTGVYASCKTLYCRVTARRDRNSFFDASYAKSFLRRIQRRVSHHKPSYGRGVMARPVSREPAVSGATGADCSWTS